MATTPSPRTESQPAPITIAAVRERALYYIAAHRCMSLATQGPEGLWVATVFYVNDDFDLFFVSRNDTRHVRNIVATQRAAVAISDDVAIWERIGGVQLEGTTEEVSEGRRSAVLAEFQRRYPFPNKLWWSSP